MKLSTFVAVASLLLGSATALAPTPSSSSSTSSSTSSKSTSTRRGWLQNVAGVAAAIVAPDFANAGSLLDDFGADPTKISQKESPSAIALPLTKSKSVSVIEPNLRSNYYYPTNKKRYLPRIKKCNDAIPGVAESIGTGDWESVTLFAEKVADDTILPLKLYTSSLSGGGTNVKVTFTKTMSKDADLFEKNQKALLKAVAKKDQAKASTALEGMATALQDYRVVASLTGPDGGGDIPSVDEIRRAACRVQGRRFSETVNARDSRLKEALVPLPLPPPTGTTTSIAASKK
jgi:hypothetical protein